MLYMLGQRVINNEAEPICLIKVGMSRDLKKRIKNYKSDNPSAIFISSTAGVEYDEQKCHRYLGLHGRLYSGEWYQVDNDFYINCLKYGFKNGFPLKRENQPVEMHCSYTTDKNIQDKMAKLYHKIPMNFHKEDNVIYLKSVVTKC